MSKFFFNQKIDKGELRRLIAWHLRIHGRVSTLTMVEKLKKLGFHHATTAGKCLAIPKLFHNRSCTTILLRDQVC